MKYYLKNILGLKSKGCPIILIRTRKKDNEILVSAAVSQRGSQSLIFGCSYSFLVVTVENYVGL